MLNNHATVGDPALEGEGKIIFRDNYLCPLVVASQHKVHKNTLKDHQKIYKFLIEVLQWWSMRKYIWKHK